MPFPSILERKGKNNRPRSYSKLAERVMLNLFQHLSIIEYRPLSAWGGPDDTICKQNG